MGRPTPRVIDRLYTHREFVLEVAPAAKGPLCLGIKKGSSAAASATNLAESGVRKFATPNIGAILFNIKPA